ncbi:MAG: hypothetical protein NVSMB33_07400 [Ktedonobacteraceae bacterium]
MAELAGVLVGNYFLLECLAREGMVETYCARPTTRGGYDVILRLFRPAFPDSSSFRERFGTEVEKVWRCSHEHIQPLLEFGTGDELLYCATLLSDAITLEEYLAQQSEHYLPIPLVLRLVTQLCSALQYAHEHDIVHGNIQPTSILIRGNDVLLTHFGMKRSYQDGEPLTAHFEEGNAAYIAPEQALGMLRPASDIYALGVLLYRLLGGMLPYDDEDPGEIALKHTNEPIPSLRALRPDVSEALEMVVRVALSKSADARFPTPAALVQALQAAMMSGVPQVIFDLPERRIMVRSRRTRFTWSRAASFLTLSVLLFSLVGTSFFIFSLPQHIYDIRGQPIWNIVQSGIANSTHGTAPSKKGNVPVSLTVPPTANSVPPIGKAKPPTPATPSGGVSSTPISGIGITTPTPLAATPTPSLVVCASGTLSIDGSPTMEPLLQQIANDYQQQCPAFTIVLNGSGSRAGLNALQQYNIDVASSDLSARPERNLIDQPVAALLYAVIVSPDVQINGLSSTALQDIYQGRVTNWSQVGGPDEAITVMQHPVNDPMTAIFRTFVLNDAAIHVSGPRLKRDWVQAVSQTPGAISYVPLMDVTSSDVSVLAIDGSLPTTQALLQGTYSFWTVEHLYTQVNGPSQFQIFLPFLSSTQETSIFARYSAISVSMLPQAILASHLPGPEI